MESNVEISSHTVDGVELVELSGKAELHSHQELRAAIRHAIHCGRPWLVLNLTRASGIDSLTIGELVACAKRSREAGGDVKLVVAPGTLVHELLQLTGLERIFQIFGDEHEAAAAFSSRSD
jgi:anti-sigma B factor antagonist